MSIKILTVAACPFPVPQGSQTLIEETMRASMAAGHEVVLVCYGYGAGPDPEGLTIRRCANVFGSGATAAGPTWRKPFQDGAMISRVRRVAQSFRPGVVHAHNYEGLAVALASGLRPVVYHAHNAMADELPHFLPYGGVGAKVGGALDRELPRRADRAIALHGRQADYLIACGCDPARVAVIPPCIDAAPFSTTEDFAAEPPVLYMGNLDAYQNLPLLQRAMTILRSTRPGARLRVATASGGRLAGAACVDAPDLASLTAILREDAVVAVPRTSWSGYPMKTLNAMAAGKAVVACAGAAYGVEDGVTGLVVADDDAAGFAAALERLMDDEGLRRSMGAAARERVERLHSRAAMGAALTAVYGGLGADSESYGAGGS